MRPQPLETASDVVVAVLRAVLVGRYAYARDVKYPTVDVWKEHLPLFLKGLLSHFREHSLGTPEACFEPHAKVICFESDFHPPGWDKGPVRVFDEGKAFLKNIAYLATGRCDSPKPGTLLRAWAVGQLRSSFADYAKVDAALAQLDVPCPSVEPPYPGIPMVGYTNGRFVLAVLPDRPFAWSFVEFAQTYRGRLSLEWSAAARVMRIAASVRQPDAVLWLVCAPKEWLLLAEDGDDEDSVRRDIRRELSEGSDRRWLGLSKKDRKRLAGSFGGNPRRWLHLLDLSKPDKKYILFDAPDAPVDEIRENVYGPPDLVEVPLAPRKTPKKQSRRSPKSQS